MRWLAPALLVSCSGTNSINELETVAFFGNSVRLALAEGDFDRAVDASWRGLGRYPNSSVMLSWRALIAQMQWQDSRALALLRRLRQGDDYAGIEHAELMGRIGDVLFRTGSYSDSIAYLNAGAVGPHGPRREALVKLARELPYERIQPGKLVAELPLLDGVLPSLLCSIGSRQRPFVLDTGASMTALTRSLATELNVTPIVEAGEATDGAGRALPVALGVLHALSLGTVRLDSQPVLVVDDEALSLKDPFGGPSHAPKAVVGLDVLARFRVTFDPVRRSVLFELSRGLDERRAVDCVQFDGRCLVPVTVEGRRLWFTLDTGASHSSLTEAGLAVLPGAVRRARSSFRRIRTPGGGVVSVRQVEDLEIETSDVRFAGVTLAVVDRGPPGIFPVHGVLGADLVMRCRTTFDRGRLLLRKL